MLPRLGFQSRVHLFWPELFSDRMGNEQFGRVAASRNGGSVSHDIRGEADGGHGHQQLHCLQV